MPIWSVMWAQSRVDPASASLALSAARISEMRSAMALHSAVHLARSWASPRTSATTRAPCTGGLEYMGRMTALSCDSSARASAASAQTMDSAPTRSP